MFDLILNDLIKFLMLLIVMLIMFMFNNILLIVSSTISYPLLIITTVNIVFVIAYLLKIIINAFNYIKIRNS